MAFYPEVTQLWGTRGFTASSEMCKVHPKESKSTLLKNTVRAEQNLDEPYFRPPARVSVYRCPLMTATSMYQWMRLQDSTTTRLRAFRMSKAVLRPSSELLRARGTLGAVHTAETEDGV